VLYASNELQLVDQGHLVRQYVHETKAIP